MHLVMFAQSDDTATNVLLLSINSWKYLLETYGFITGVWIACYTTVYHCAVCIVRKGVQLVIGRPLAHASETQEFAAASQCH